MPVRSFLLLLVPLLFTACPPDLMVAPAFVTLEDFDLRVRNGEGAATGDITEVWAFADGEFIGVFPLPARIPVFREGTTALRLEAGIRQDGRSVTPDIYPFYTPVEQDFNLVAGETIALGVLPIGYRTETIFGFIEDFEPDRSPVFTDILTPTVGLAVQSDVVRSGTSAGVIELTDTSRIIEIASAPSFSGLNEVPINVWLEADFRSDAPAVVGVTGQRNGITVREFDPGFLPRPDWTKIYFNLGTVIGRADLPEIRIVLSTRLADERSGGSVYLDNLKLLYFTAP